MENNKYIVGIGASNVDIYGNSRIVIRTHYDHPADIHHTVGGVIHNIMTNFALLGGNCKIISAVGDDGLGKIILDDYKKNNIDTSEILVSKTNPSGVFMQVQDENNDMYLALCDQTALSELTRDYLKSKEEILLNAKLVMIDPSIPSVAIETILEICRNKVPVYVDPVSDNFAAILTKYIPDLYCVKPNKTELESLSGMIIKNDYDIEDACRYLISKGLKKIYVSLSKEGLLYMDKDKCIKKNLFVENNMVNASGAGDCLMGAILYGETNDMNVEDIMDLGMAAGIANVRVQETIRKDLSIDLLKSIIKEKN